MNGKCAESSRKKKKIHLNITFILAADSRGGQKGCRRQIRIVLPLDEALDELARHGAQGKINGDGSGIECADIGFGSQGDGEPDPTGVEQLPLGEGAVERRSRVVEGEENADGALFALFVEMGGEGVEPVEGVARLGKVLFRSYFGAGLEALQGGCAIECGTV